MVSKEALIEAAWPGQAVEEGNLTVQIAALRRAFGTVSGGDGWIETMPRRGYRFVGPVRAAEAASLALPEKPSLVILPFQNMTGDAEQEYFVDGMVEEITTAIARLPWLFVIARNSAFTYKGKPLDVKQMARELGVRYVLEGSVRKAANRVRITGQLIDTATGAHIWADHFDGALDDIFDLQDQVASNVAGAIEPKLRQSEIERASSQAGREPHRLRPLSARIGTILPLYRRGTWRGGRPRPAGVGDRSVLRAGGGDDQRLSVDAAGSGVGSVVR